MPALATVRAEIRERAVPEIADHTGGAELVQAERLRAGELDACAVSNWTLAELRAGGDDEGLEVAWTSPPVSPLHGHGDRWRPTPLMSGSRSCC